MKTPSDYLTKYRTRLRKKKCPASVEKDTIISDVTTQKNKKELKKNSNDKTGDVDTEIPTGVEFASLQSEDYTLGKQEIKGKVQEIVQTTENHFGSKAGGMISPKKPTKKHC